MESTKAALPALHAEMKADTPKPYNGLIEAYREIIPAILRQVKDPAYFVKRELPPSAKPFPAVLPATQPAS